MDNIYDDKAFFAAYSRMARSTGGLEAAGEWHQLQPLFPAMEGSRVLDLGCGYGWHCKYAVEQGAAEALGLDLSEKMIAEARARNADPHIRYEVCGIAEYSYPAGYYDLVVSNLALHYLADLDDIYRKVFSTPRPAVYSCSISNTRSLLPVYGRTGSGTLRAVRSAGRWTTTIIPGNAPPSSWARRSKNSTIPSPRS